MNIKNKVRSVKCGVLGALVAVGLSAFADPSVTVDKVESAEPWDSTTGKITVNYTLGGVGAATKYKVAFDITAGGKTASVTNDAAKLTDGAATKEINTVAIFGKEVVDTKAKVKVSLIAIKPIDYSTPIQLWENGPYFAQCNVGATVPGDYGEIYTFNDNKAADAAASLGDGWRLPLKDELQGLLDNCARKWETCKNSTGAEINGFRFTGKEGFADKSIFLPAAGYARLTEREYAGERGRYWSSKVTSNMYAGYLYITKDNPNVSDNGDRSYATSVRAVRDAK